MKILKPPYGIVSAKLSVVCPPECLKEDILNAFTFKNPLYAQAERFSPWGAPKNIEQFIMLADYDGRVLRFPRGIDPERQLTAKSLAIFRALKWKQETTDAAVLFPDLRVTPNSDQKTLLGACQTALNTGSRPFRNYLFVATTSAGKTIAQAMIAAHLKQRVLVLCLTELIKRAWYQDLELAYGIAKKDIGIIQQSKWKLGEHFTLASVATLARRRERWPELLDHIGTVIVDEADTISSPSIYNFLMDFPAKNLVGATATTNKSLRSFYLDSIFGPPVKRIATKQVDTSTSMALQQVRPIPTAFKYAYAPGMIDFHDLMLNLMADEERNKLICHHVHKDWQEGRAILLTVKRVAHAVLLTKMLRTEYGIKRVRLMTGETNADRKGTEYTIQDIFDRKVRVVVATSEAVKRGGNLNPLDTLHLAAPVNKTALEQLIGRVRRTYPGKTKCELVYYWDKSVPYLNSLYFHEAIAVFRKLKVPKFINTWVL